jgi:hypothetical protein
VVKKSNKGKVGSKALAKSATNFGLAPSKLADTTMVQKLIGSSQATPPMGGKLYGLVSSFEIGQIGIVKVEHD